MTNGGQGNSAQQAVVPGTLNIEEFLKCCKPRLDPKEYESLEIALSSIGKRIGYCALFYDEFMDVYDSAWLGLERIGKCTPDPRLKYEAYAYAFLQNLHALIDCLPYALNIAVRRGTKMDVEHGSVRWNYSFVNRYQNESFFPELESLWKDQNFSILAGFVTRTKHKHLVRIRNDFTKLVFEDFSYPKDDKLELATELDVKALMVDCHDQLMPKFISVYNAVLLALKT